MPVNDPNYSLIGKLVPLALVVVVLLGLAQSAFVIVESGHVGVVRSFGAVQDKVLDEGIHFKKPIMDKVEQIDIRLTAVQAEASAASKDLQTVSTKVTTQYSLNGVLAPRIYQRVGDRDKVAVSVVEPAIQESVKAVTAKFTAEELVTQREAVRNQIAEAINKFIELTLSEKEITAGVRIANVAITDFNFSEEFNRAIELKVRAEQEALQAKNEKLKLVTQAEAAAQQVQLKAGAQAYQIEVESKMRADAIEREAKALTGNPELIQLRMIEKWDGVLPRFNGGGAIPMLDLNEFDKQGKKEAAAGE